MRHIILCEDNLDHGNLLADIIKNILTEPAAIFICQSILELEELLQVFPTPDIVFMDIELGKGENGIHAVSRLIPETLKTQVIYITGYLKYCTQVYRTPHISFLVKPFKPIEVQTALEQAFKKKKKMELEGIGITVHSQIICIPFFYFFYIESFGRKLRFVCIDTTYESYMRLKDAIPLLDTRFFQCHKSYIVNLGQVAIYDAKNYVLRSGEYIPISAKYRRDAKRIFMNFLSKDIDFSTQVR